jgi:uncharacterized integral membrane protein
MIRKIVRALILIPLAIVLVALAVANRHPVTISFDPFNPTEPAFSLTIPLYVLILALVIAGVILGGVASWIRQGKWRGRARHAEVRARALRTENDQLKRREGAVSPATATVRANHAPRLTIPPPAR